MANKPLVALVGRPNVGKSTLFNRFVGARVAVVDDRPGTTRDRIFGETDWRGVFMSVVDTGGIEELTVVPVADRDRKPTDEPLAEDSAQFIPEIRSQAELAIASADVIVMVVDIMDGVTAADEEVAGVLRRTNKPVLIAANKADNAQRREGAYDFYSLGLGEVFPISAQHGSGTGDLLDAIVDNLPFRGDETEEDEDEIKIAILGRPNVGKSSLLNRLLGEERSIVSPVPGTTRDAIDTHLTWYDTPIMLVDTAGIRRRGKVESGVEKYSVLRAMQAIKRTDVALLMIDASEGVTAQDQHVASFILEENKSVAVLVNKWDLVEKDTHTMPAYLKQLRYDLRFMDYVPVLFISALTGQRVDKVLPTAVQIREERLVRIQTSKVNRILRNAMAAQSPPSKAGKQLKIRYGSQVSVDPPTFVFSVNDEELVHFSYERYLENQIRAYYPFTGTPLRLSFRRSSEDRFK